jgi:hypothetical protein
MTAIGRNVKGNRGLGNGGKTSSSKAATAVVPKGAGDGLGGKSGKGAKVNPGKGKNSKSGKY